VSSYLTFSALPVSKQSLDHRQFKFLQHYLSASISAKQPPY